MQINPDGITREGALRHAKMIAAYWEKRGYHVLPTVVDTGVKCGTSNGNVYGVRSDMVNGQPQKGKR